MTQVQTDAIRKLTEAKVKTFQNKRDFLVSPLRSILCGFCEQSEEFAAAVMADGKSLEGCVNDMKVPQGELVSLSDFDVYRMAVQYFFHEADVEWLIKISVPAKKQTSAKILDLTFADFFKSGPSGTPVPTKDGDAQ